MPSNWANNWERLGRRSADQRWDLGTACSTTTSQCRSTGVEARASAKAARSRGGLDGDAWWHHQHLRSLKAAWRRALPGAKEASAYGNATNTGLFTLASPGAPRFNDPRPQAILSLLTRSKRRARPAWSATQHTQFLPRLAQRASEADLPQQRSRLRQQQLSTAASNLTPGPRSGRNLQRVPCACLWRQRISDIAAALMKPAELTSPLDYAPICHGTYRLCVQPRSVSDLVGAFSNLSTRALLEWRQPQHLGSLATSLAVPPLHP